MSNANAAAPALLPSEAIANVLLVSDDASVVKQLTESMLDLAMSAEVCSDVNQALGLLNRTKFEAVVVDLNLGPQAKMAVEKVRASRSNRTAVLFAISSSDEETASAFRDGCSFVLKRPLSPSLVDRTLRVAYGLIVRERRRYFRCPVEVPASIRGVGTGAGLPETEALIVNISQGGIAITTAVSIKAGVQLQVQFTLPGHSSRFVTEAAVCWCKEHFLGLQFVSLSSQLKPDLEAWLSRKLEESLPPSVVEKFRNLTGAPPLKQKE
jgi:CheY-like chemotaxis protein